MLNAGFVRIGSVKGRIITLLFYLLIVNGNKDYIPGRRASLRCSRDCRFFPLLPQRYDVCGKRLRQRGALYFPDTPTIRCHLVKIIPTKLDILLLLLRRHLRPLMAFRVNPKKVYLGRLPGYSSTVAARFRLYLPKKVITRVW